MNYYITLTHSISLCLPLSLLSYPNNKVCNSLHQPVAPQSSLVIRIPRTKGAVCYYGNLIHCGIHPKTAHKRHLRMFKDIEPHITVLSQIRNHSHAHRAPPFSVESVILIKAPERLSAAFFGRVVSLPLDAGSRAASQAPA